MDFITRREGDRIYIENYGLDEDMYKDAAFLRPVLNPPLYAIYSARSIDSTQGGITINGDFEAVTPGGKAIKGMYVVGDHASGFVSDHYAPLGAGLTWAMVSGYLAGESAAEAGTNA